MAKKVTWSGKKNVQNDKNIAEFSVVSPVYRTTCCIDIIHLGYHLLASRFEIFFFFFLNSDSAIVQKCDS